MLLTDAPPIAGAMITTTILAAVTITKWFWLLWLLQLLRNYEPRPSFYPLRDPKYLLLAFVGIWRCLLAQEIAKFRRSQPFVYSPEKSPYVPTKPALRWNLASSSFFAIPLAK